MATSVNSVGVRLREARIRAGLSQRDLAEPGVSYAYISRIESGVRTPSVKVLRRIAPKLGVSVSWLETGEEDAAEGLARMVIEYDGVPPPDEALELARRVVER